MVGDCQRFFSPSTSNGSGIKNRSIELQARYLSEGIDIFLAARLVRRAPRPLSVSLLSAYEFVRSRRSADLWAAPQRQSRRHLSCDLRNPTQIAAFSANDSLQQFNELHFV
jgi:hypothetical protein